MDQIIRRHLEPLNGTEDKSRKTSAVRSASLFTANNLAIFLILLAHILYIIFQYTTVNHVVKLIDLLPGAQRIPDLDRDHIFEIIESRGFQYEQHFVTTEDGYILQLIRLVNPYSKGDHLKPVLLHHGFQTSSSSWLIASYGHLDDQGIYYEFDEQQNLLINGSHQVGNSLGFDLASRGYDVWLANYRGNVHSRNHTTLSADSIEFWQFTMDEMIHYDLPAQIDYILNKTQHPTLGYIGHSQGNLMMFAMLSSNPKHSQLIKPFVAISPVWYKLIPTDTQDMSWEAKIFLARHLLPLLEKYPRKFEFNQNVRLILKNLCSNRFVRNVCYKLYFEYFVGFLKNFDMDRLPIFIDHVGLGSSTWNFAHVVQNAERERFSRFDYGPEVNMRIHGQPEPPEYDESKINNTNMAFIYGVNDYVCTTSNVENLRANLKVNLLDLYQVPNVNYDHLDLIWGKNVGQMVNRKVVDILMKTKDN